jgi:hypothetical protein
MGANALSLWVYYLFGNVLLISGAYARFTKKNIFFFKNWGAYIRMHISMFYMLTQSFVKTDSFRGMCKKEK